MNSRLLAEIKEERQRLAAYAKDAQRRMAKAPEGSLRVATSKTRTMLYHHLENQGTTGTYLGRDKLELAQDLAQKTYDKDLLECINAEADLLDKLIAANETTSSLDAVYEELSPARKNLVTPYRQSEDITRFTWPRHVYAHLEPPTPDKALITARGEKVRSKSEVIIANTLDELGIPYRYEQELQLNRTTTVHPDFTILRLSDRKTLVWEHFGMMDDTAYCATALRKIQTYQKAGFTQGVNLIMTFESETAPLDARAVKKLTQELLL